MLSCPLMNNKSMSLRVILFVLLMGGGMHAYAESSFDSLIVKKSEVGSDVFTSRTYNPGNIKHIVLFKYKDSVTPEQKEEVIRRFLHLQQSQRPGEKRAYIINISTGLQNSGENASLGFEQAFIVTFRSEGDRNYYVGTPVVSNPEHYDNQHAKFKQFVGPLLAENNGVLVFDFAENKVGNNE